MKLGASPQGFIVRSQLCVLRSPVIRDQKGDPVRPVDGTRSVLTCFHSTVAFVSPLFLGAGANTHPLPLPQIFWMYPPSPPGR